jgi:DNA-binding transcriptional ArsR family regulator
VAQVFDAVAEPSRRAILDLLVGGPRSVGEIVEASGLSQPNASRHLRILREARIVSSRSAGQKRLYELQPEGLAELFGWLAPYRQLWGGSLDALEKHLDEKE